MSLFLGLLFVVGLVVLYLGFDDTETLPVDPEWLPGFEGSAEYHLMMRMVKRWPLQNQLEFTLHARTANREMRARLKALETL